LFSNKKTIKQQENEPYLKFLKAIWNYYLKEAKLAKSKKKARKNKKESYLRKSHFQNSNGNYRKQKRK
jgi:hypothetical protein